jgi:hypothetical protein
MQCTRYFILSLVCAMLLPISALAREKNEGKLTLFDKAQIGTTVLNPGTYTVKWMGAGPQVQVDVMQNKNMVATTNATLQSESNLQQDAVVLHPAQNAAAPEQVAEIDLAHQKEALILPRSGQQNR